MDTLKESLVHTIRVLRGRRVRPSLQNICWYISRFISAPLEKIESAINELIESDIVLKVEYKGATSYRVAACWSKTESIQSRPTKTKVNVMNSEVTSKILHNVVASFGKTGATKEQIASTLINNGQKKLSDKIQIILFREIRRGTLHKVETTRKNKCITTYTIPETNEPEEDKNMPSLKSNHVKTKKQSSANNSNINVYTSKNLWNKSNKNSKVFPTFDTSDSGICDDDMHSAKDIIFEDDSNKQSMRKMKTSSVSRVKSVSGDGVGASPMVGKIPCSPTSDDQTGGGRRAKSEYKRLMEEAGEGTSTRTRGRPKRYQEGLDLSDIAAKKGRQPSQRPKRPKKVYDPSEGLLAGSIPIMTKKCSLSPTPSSSTISLLPPLSPLVAQSPGVGMMPYPQKCNVCLQSSVQLHPEDELLVCQSCSARAHPSCLGYSQELAIKSRQQPWTCMDCKHCAVCNMDHNVGTLIFCDECDRAYHLTCHHPRLDEQPQGSWICCWCNPNPNNPNPFDLPGLPTPRESPVPEEDNLLNFECAIPDVTHWSVDQVVEYFVNEGFAEFTNTFLEQDIDGTALLMLTRSDVLMNLNLKLGPALKIYKHVRILQTRIPNPPLI